MSFSGLNCLPRRSSSERRLVSLAFWIVFFGLKLAGILLFKCQYFTNVPISHNHWSSPDPNLLCWSSPDPNLLCGTNFSGIKESLIVPQLSESSWMQFTISSKLKKGLLSRFRNWGSRAPQDQSFGMYGILWNRLAYLKGCWRLRISWFSSCSNNRANGCRHTSLIFTHSSEILKATIHWLKESSETTRSTTVPLTSLRMLIDECVDSISPMLI